MTSLELGLALGLPFLGVTGGIVKWFDSRLRKKQDKENCGPHIKAVDEVKVDIKRTREDVAYMKGVMSAWAEKNGIAVQ